MPVPYREDSDVIEAELVRRDLSQEIAASARALVAFLDANVKTRTLRYTYHFWFPRNCCEGASIIFKYLLEEKYGLADARVIRGTDPRNGERHFWVRAGGLAYDLTGAPVRPLETDHWRVQISVERQVSGPGRCRPVGHDQSRARRRPVSLCQDRVLMPSRGVPQGTARIVPWRKF
ncbi:hypothetical protein ACFB49_30310 [Sphingomonas sp. DBB INV C78]